ncbi:MAG: hypothetical protein ACKVOE_07250 [Rickettsiales bacterium]
MDAMNTEPFTHLPYLWHNVPASMDGNLLWPLKALHEIKPELAARYQAKYKGREHIAQLHVPVLDCLWDEVIFLSPIHPQLFNRAMHEAGHKVFSREVFQFKADVLENHEAVWFDPVQSGKDGALLPASIRPFDPRTYHSRSVSKYALPYYQRCAVEGRQPLIWGRDLHVIVRGYTRDGKTNPIDVRHAETIITEIPSS